MLRMITLCLVLLVVLSWSIENTDASIPVPEQFFPLQNIDHLDPDNKGLWTQRYYTYGKHFQGPGHPIFLILGGEGAISPEAGILYPFVADHLAKTFGGFVLQPEHRFYGKSQPLQGRTATIKGNEYSNYSSTQEDPRVKLFTSEQALYDAMVLLDSVRADLGCAPKSNQTLELSSINCPVVTVGGSYPGFLSAFARMLFPNIVDMAYAASAPMGFYAQETDRFAYYDHITTVAEDTLPGCAKAVKSVLLKVSDLIGQAQSVKELESVAKEVGICEGSIPDYIFANGGNEEAGVNASGFQTTAMTQELMMVVGYTFANDNMASYPPGKDTRLYKACEIFSSEELSPAEKVNSYLTQRLRHRKQIVGTSLRKSQSSCWNMSNQLPTGPNATISGGDWSGDGTGPSGESWDFQTCTLLVEAIGFSEGKSMFPARDWTLEWMQEHCQSRFGVVPRPYELVRRFRFGENDLASTNVTRILFTNGLKDGWSVGGIQANLSDSIIALNFENGAHHSDLSHMGPDPSRDTNDLTEGFKAITRLLGEWLSEVSGRSIISSTEWQHKKHETDQSESM